MLALTNVQLMKTSCSNPLCPPRTWSSKCETAAAAALCATGSGALQRCLVLPCPWKKSSLLFIQSGFIIPCGFISGQGFLLGSRAGCSKTQAAISPANIGIDELCFPKLGLSFSFHNDLRCKSLIININSNDDKVKLGLAGTLVVLLRVGRAVSVVGLWKMGISWTDLGLNLPSQECVAFCIIYWRKCVIRPVFLFLS